MYFNNTVVRVKLRSMELLKKMICRLRQDGYTNIQLLVLVAFIIMAFFLSDSNIFMQISYNNKIRNLNNQIEFYRNQTARDKKQLELLKSDKESIEKFAREHFLMKRANEDVFIIE